jgi:hypothetical protein
VKTIGGSKQTGEGGGGLMMAGHKPVAEGGEKKEGRMNRVHKQHQQKKDKKQ